MRLRRKIFSKITDKLLTKYLLACIILFGVLMCRNLRQRGVLMLLDFKNIFLNEGVHRLADYKLDLSSVAVDGVNPMPEPVTVTAEAVNTAGAVRLIIKAEFLYSRPCDRCFSLTNTNMSLKFEHNLVVSLSGESNDDYIEIPDYTLDLDELVTTDILLELPLKYLCSEDCRGLCQSCGQNLNNGDCKCGKTAVDPRLEVLKQLLN